MVSPLAPILKMYARMGAIPVKRCPMNVTVRASLIALIAIVGACWAIPVFLVRVVPSDAGMIAMMTLIYLVLPVTAIALGLLAANSARTLFWIPAALGIGSALLFPLAVEGSRDLAFHGVAYTAIGYAAMGLRTWTIARQHR